MKKVFFILCLLVTSFLHAQKVKLHQVMVDKKDTYEIPAEDKNYNTLFGEQEENEKVRASLVVNGDTVRSIRSTKSELKGDTLKILVYQTDPAYHHKYMITVVKDKYYIEYNFLTSGEQMKRKINTLESKLKLNSLDFSNGKEIRGYTEFKGKCSKGCWEDSIFVKGNFKILIE